MDRSFVQVFLAEAIDTLDEWEKVCLAASSGLADESCFSLLFRLAHNTKGSSQSVGLKAFGSFVHEVENLIKALRDDVLLRRKIENWPNILLDCQSIMMTWIDHINKETLASEVQLESAVAKTAELKAILSNGEESQEPGGSFDAPLQDAGVVFDLEQFEKYANQKTEGISAPEKKSEKHVVTELSQSQSQSKQPPESASSKKQESHLKLKTQEVAVLCENIQSIISDFQELNYSISQQKKSNKLTSDSSDDSFVTSFKFQKLERLLFQALEYAQQFMDQTPDIFAQRLQRAVLDLAKMQNKKVVFKVIGETEKIRNDVLSGLVNAMTHMVRNSVDHGIESPETRAQLGKPECAIIVLSFRSSGIGSTIELSDDGGGLNKDRILQTAISKNLLSRYEAKRLSDPDIWKLIFLPGFSTKENVTDVSGRGVGMDVVQNAIQDFGGQIEIHSQPGQGTRFKIFIPSPSSSQKCLMVRSGGVLFAIPDTFTDCVIDISRSDCIGALSERPSLSRKGVLFPLFRLCEFFPVEQSGCQPASEKYGVVIDQSELRCCVSFEEIVGVENVVLKKMGQNLRKIQDISGVTQRPNGDLVYVLNPEQWAKKIQKTGVGYAA